MLPPSPLPASADPGQRLDDLVRQEQVRMMLDRTRRSNLLAVPGGMLIVWLLWPHIAHTTLVMWLAAKVIVCLLRVWIDRCAFAQAPARLPRWSARYEVALALDGTLFGMMGWVLLPENPVTINAAMAATLIGVAAIGLVVLSANWRAAIAFTMPVLVPGMLHLLIQHDRISQFLGLGMLLYSVVLIGEVRKASAHTASMLRVRFQMDQLASDRQAALELAQRSNTAKSQFLATMSHEMRTPLHGILGLTRELQRTEASPLERLGQLDTLRKTGDHLLGVINDVLDYSALEAGSVRLSEQAFDASALLQGLHALVKVSAAEHGLELRLDNGLGPACWVLGDALRLRQVLLNLLGNAIKFTEHGHVTLRARRHKLGDAASPRVRVSFEVADTGPGVPRDERERIFNAFHQSDGAFNRRKGGTGLGLTISRELALAMGGALQCLDTAGPGACFRLELELTATEAEPPLPRSQAAATSPDSVESRSDPRWHVLLAEDNDVNALVARTILERAGARVDHAPDGEQAVALAQRGGYDLVLMDCQMPGLDGFEATTRIRAHERQHSLQRVRIVALTANALAGDRERCLAAGMDDHLSKPFDAPELLRLLGVDATTA